MIHLLLIQVCLLLDLTSGFVLFQLLDPLFDFILLLNEVFKLVLSLKFSVLQIGHLLLPSFIFFFHSYLEVFFVVSVSKLNLVIDLLNKITFILEAL